MANYTASDVQTYVPSTGVVTSAVILEPADGSCSYPNIDLIAPVAAVNSPTAGSTLAASSTPLVVDVTDDSSLQRVIIFATFSDGTAAEMVYDGTSFQASYSASSARSSITGGYRYSVVRANGWRTNPSLKIYALDNSSTLYRTKNELDFTTFSWVFAPDTASPSIAANTPGAGTTLASKSTSLVVDVTDSSTISRAILVMKFGDSRPPELAWDGSAQQSGYTVSTSVIGGGTRYTITRTATDGWRTNPKVYLYAVDNFGNEALWGHVDYVFTPDAADPAIASHSPVAGSTLISKDAEIALDITDASALGTIILVATYDDGNAEEVVHDGTDFGPGYTGDVDAIAGGYRYTFTRDDGWRKDPTFSHYAIDALGNEALP